MGGIERVAEGSGRIKVAAHEVQVRGEGAQPGVDAGGSEVAETQDLPDFAGGEEGAELRGDVLYLKISVYVYHCVNMETKGENVGVMVNVRLRGRE